MSRKILSADQIEKIIQRIAVQILENNCDEEHIILIGIHDQGYKIAQRILDAYDVLEIDEKPEIQLISLQINKANPGDGTIALDQDKNLIVDKPIVIVDDVLNTSKTLAFTLQFLLTSAIRKVETAVLVNRSHAKFPISATYTGFELATTLEDHIEVRIEEGAFLN